MSKHKRTLIGPPIRVAAADHQGLGPVTADALLLQRSLTSPVVGTQGCAGASVAAANVAAGATLTRAVKAAAASMQRSAPLKKVSNCWRVHCS